MSVLFFVSKIVVNPAACSRPLGSDYIRFLEADHTILYQNRFVLVGNASH